MELGNSLGSAFVPNEKGITPEKDFSELGILSPEVMPDKPQPVSPISSMCHASAEKDGYVKKIEEDSEDEDTFIQVHNNEPSSPEQHSF